MPHKSSSEPQPLTQGTDDLEKISGRYLSLLKSIAIRKFRVPADDADALAHEVLLGYLSRSDKILDLEKWMIGAICNASRYYWRQHRRPIELLDPDIASALPDSASQSIADALSARIAVGEVLAGLPPRYQHILRLRFYEGRSISEIAQELSLTPKYAQRLVTRCLRRLDELVDVDRTPLRESENQELREVVAGFVEAYRDVG
jgi:RNA polymerase sigma-70 factor (ECF subfamily)